MFRGGDRVACRTASLTRIARNCYSRRKAAHKSGGRAGMCGRVRGSRKTKYDSGMAGRWDGGRVGGTAGGEAGSV